jgi:hypothetical protein
MLSSVRRSFCRRLGMALSSIFRLLTLPGYPEILGYFPMIQVFGNRN